MLIENLKIVDPDEIVSWTKCNLDCVFETQFDE